MPSSNELLRLMNEDSGLLIHSTLLHQAVETENDLKLIPSLDSCKVVILHSYALRGYLKITFLFSDFHILSHNLIYPIARFTAGSQNKPAIKTQAGSLGF